MNLSVNQVRQLYVGNCFEEKVSNITNKSEIGTIGVGVDDKKSHLYLTYRGADNLMRSDLINIKNFLYGKATNADALAHKLKALTVKLNGNVNDGSPVPGQDYVLRIAFTQFVGMSDEDKYFKYGAVRTYNGMDTAAFWQAMAVSLFKNFSRELEPLVSFTLNGSVVAGTKMVDGKTVPVDEDGKTIEGSADGITVTELPQEWRRGIKEQVPVYFVVEPTTVWYDADETPWGVVTKADGSTMNDGRTIADMEYFCMGERGDQYRGINWPNNIPTHYLVDASKAYHVLDLHYAYVGDNEGPQKSEKTITIVSTDSGIINSIISAVNAAITDQTGITIESL